MTYIMDCSLLHNVVTDLLKLKGCINVCRWHSCRFHFIKTHMELKLLMEALAQFGLAIDMLIIFVLSVLSEVSSYKAKICVLGMLKHSQPFDRKQSSATSLSHTFPPITK